MSAVRRQKPKAAVREEEGARLRTLRDYAILDTPPEAAFERIARMAARFLSVPIALVTFVDENRQWFKAACGLEENETTRRDSFCNHTILDDEVMVVPDAALDERFTDNPLVTGRPFVRFYAGAPLRAPNGHNLGALCVCDFRPRQLDPAEIQTLQELAATVVEALELRRAAAALRAEVAGRIRVEHDLAEALRSVESQVRARTAELSHRNRELRSEVNTRREAEAALGKSELLFRELAENIKQVFWMYDGTATEQVYVSPAFEAIWGRPLGPDGKMMENWADTIHPDDRVRVTANFAARAASGRYEEEYRVLRPDGTLCWVRDRAFPIHDDAGRVYRIAGIATDITGRKHQEAVTALRARQQQTVAELGAFALRGGEVKALLDEGCRMVRETLGMDVCGVAEHLPERGVFMARAVAGVADGEPPTQEIPDGRGSGSGYALLTQGPVVVENTATETRFKIARWIQDAGVCSGIIVLIGGVGTQSPSYGTLNSFSVAQRSFSPDDVFFMQGVANVLAAAISRRRGEEALQAAKEEAELANSAKSRFLSRMSHELRTPLNAILGFGQILEMDVATGRQRECVAHVLAGGQHLLALIDDVLDVARLEPGRADPAPEDVPARDAILAGIDLVLPLAGPRRVSVELEDNAAAGRAVFVNHRRLGQVLFHLLSNAVKYNRPGGRVTVSCRAMPGARLRLSVTDTGPGIAPEHFERLFVPFDRLGAEAGNVPGTGLGLALCKNLVESQGGQIGVESKAGRGSTFWIQLPLAAPAGTDSSSRTPRQAVRTVLYVEDNLSNLRLIERLLQRRPGIRLLTATQGREGLELARRRRPDLVLLDLHLPDLPGRDVLAELQADPTTREMPVVVISADALPAHIEEICAAGARRYLTKPLDVHQLVEMLAELA